MYWSMDRLFSRCMMNVFCMYLELASTACMRCGDTWIMCGSHNTRPTCGIRPKYILIHVQIHVSVRGVSSPNWGGIMTMPVLCGGRLARASHWARRSPASRGRLLRYSRLVQGPLAHLNVFIDFFALAEYPKRSLAISRRPADDAKTRSAGDVSGARKVLSAADRRPLLHKGTLP